MEKKLIEDEKLLEAAVGGVSAVTTKDLEASEDLLEDADEAKEMTAYTINSIMQQAAQAMLAQSDSNAAKVLGLLK